jgi:mono/diheme cytochrome c family protein
MNRRLAAAIAAGALARWGLGLLLAASSVACEPADKTPVGRGARVFQRTCAGCHGADGRGVMRLGLVKPPRDLTNPEFHAQVTDDQLRSVIRTGKNQMPAFGGLMGEEDLRNVIAFIRTLPPGARAPQPSSSLPGAATGPSVPSSAQPPSAAALPAELPGAPGEPGVAPPSARVSPASHPADNGGIR